MCSLYFLLKTSVSVSWYSYIKVWMSIESAGVKVSCTYKVKMRCEQWWVCSEWSMQSRYWHPFAQLWSLLSRNDVSMLCSGLCCPEMTPVCSAVVYAVQKWCQYALLWSMQSRNDVSMLCCGLCVHWCSPVDVILAISSGLMMQFRHMTSALWWVEETMHLLWFEGMGIHYLD